MPSDYAVLPEFPESTTLVVKSFTVCSNAYTHTTPEGGHMTITPVVGSDGKPSLRIEYYEQKQKPKKVYAKELAEYRRLIKAQQLEIKEARARLNLAVLTTETTQKKRTLGTSHILRQLNKKK